MYSGEVEVNIKGFGYVFLSDGKSLSLLGKRYTSYDSVERRIWWGVAINTPEKGSLFGHHKKGDIHWYALWFVALYWWRQPMDVLWLKDEFRGANRGAGQPEKPTELQEPVGGPPDAL